MLIFLLDLISGDQQRSKGERLCPTVQKKQKVLFADAEKYAKIPDLIKLLLLVMTTQVM